MSTSTDINDYMNGAGFPSSRESTLRLVHVLVENGQSLDIPNRDTGRTLLHIAAYNFDIELAQVLLENGATPNSVEHYGHTPLFEALASSNDSTRMVGLLVDFGADPNITDARGYAALHQSVIVRNPDAMFILIKGGGAVLDATTNDDETPLIIAINTKYLDGIRVLLEHGSNPNLIIHGTTPLLHAVAMQDIDTVRLLLEYGANPNVNGDDILVQEYSLTRPILKLLMQYGAQIPDDYEPENDEISELWQDMQTRQAMRSVLRKYDVPEEIGSMIYPPSVSILPSRRR